MKWLKRQRDDGQDEANVAISEQDLVDAGAPASRVDAFLRQFGIETSRPLRAHSKATSFLRIWGMVFAAFSLFCFLMVGVADDQLRSSCFAFDSAFGLSVWGAFFAGAIAAGGLSVLMYGAARISVQSREQHDELMRALQGEEDGGSTPTMLEGDL